MDEEESKGRGRINQINFSLADLILLHGSEKLLASHTLHLDVSGLIVIIDRALYIFWTIGHTITIFIYYSSDFLSFCKKLL